jgi:hypothetical protein
MSAEQHQSVVAVLERKLSELMAVHAHQSATFVAEKLVTLTNSSPKAIFALAQAHLSGAQYARVVALLSAPRCAALLQTYLYARYLLAQAHFARRRFELCARVLSADDTTNANQCKYKKKKSIFLIFFFFFFSKLIPLMLPLLCLCRRLLRLWWLLCARCVAEPVWRWSNVLVL